MLENWDLWLTAAGLTLLVGLLLYSRFEPRYQPMFKKDYGPIQMSYLAYHSQHRPCPALRHIVVARRSGPVYFQS